MCVGGGVVNVILSVMHLVEKGYFLFSVLFCVFLVQCYLDAF